MFADREEAGRLLGQAVAERHPVDTVVIALPRGGVPVAVQVARALNAPLDLLLVRKIGAPGQPELAVGAVAEGVPPAVVVDERTLDLTGTPLDYVKREANAQLEEIERRRKLYLGNSARVPLAGRTVVLVDDGLATGSTVRAALQALRRRGPARIVLAVPVAPADALQALRASVDDVVCLSEPEFFGGVGAHYCDFHQVGDNEVMALMHDAARHDPDRAARRARRA
jgi:putative phosphoribosyl transferase